MVTALAAFLASNVSHPRACEETVGEPAPVKTAWRGLRRFAAHCTAIRRGPKTLHGRQECKEASPGPTGYDTR